MKVYKIILISFFMILFSQLQVFSVEKTELVVQKQHSSTISSLSFSPDGKYIASLEKDNQTVKIWDVQSKKLLMSIENNERINIEHFAFSWDNKFFGLIYSNMKLNIWNLSSKENIYQIKGYFKHFSFNPKHKIISINSDDNIKIIDFINKKTIKSIDILNVNSTSYDELGSRLAISTFENIQFWDTIKWEKIKEIKGNSSNTNIISIDRSSSLIAGGSQVGKIYLWDLNSGEIVKTINDDLLGNINALSFSYDSNYLIASGKDKIKIFNLKTGDLFKEFNSSSYTVDVDNEFKFVISADNTGYIKLWSINSGKLIKEFYADPMLMEIKFLSKDKIEYKTGSNGIYVIDINTGKDINIRSDYPSDYLFENKDKKFFDDFRKNILVFDKNTNNKIVEISNFNNNGIFHNSYDKEFLASINNNEVNILDLKTFKISNFKFVNAIRNHPIDAFFSYDNRYFLVNNFNSILLIDIQNNLIRELKGNNEYSSKVIYKNKKFYFYTNDYLKVFDDNYQLLYSGRDYYITSDKLVSIKYNILEIKDIRNEKSSKIELGGNISGLKLSYSNDGNYIAYTDSYSNNKQIKILNINNGKFLQSFNVLETSKNFKSIDNSFSKIILKDLANEVYSLWDLKNRNKTKINIENNLLSYDDSIYFNKSSSQNVIMRHIDKSLDEINIFENEKKIKSFYMNLKSMIDFNLNDKGEPILALEEKDNLDFLNIYNKTKLKSIKKTNIVNYHSFSKNFNYIIQFNKDTDFNKDIEFNIIDVKKNKKIFSTNNDSIVISPDEKYFLYIEDLIGSENSFIIINDIKTMKEIRKIKIEKDYTHKKISFTKDKKNLILESDEYIKIFDFLTMKNFYTTKFQEILSSFVVSDENKYIALVKSNIIEVFDMKLGKQVDNLVFNEPVSEIFFDDKDNIVFFNKEKLEFYNMKLKKIVKRIMLNVNNKHDIKKILFSNNKIFYSTDINNNLLIRSIDLKTNKKDILFSQEISEIGNFSFSNKDNVYFTETNGNNVNIWDLDKKSIISNFKSISKEFLIEPDMKLISHLENGFLIIRDFKSLKILKKIKSDYQGDFQKKLKLSSNKKYIYILSSDGFEIFDLNLGLKKTSMESNEKKYYGSFYDLLFYNNEIFSVNQDPDIWGNITFYDIKNKHKLFDFVGHEGLIKDIYTNSKDNIISLGYDGIIKAWSFKEKKQVYSIFFFENESCLIAMPNNYYMMSKGGSTGVAFKVENRAYPFEQFDLKYNRPDLVLKRMKDFGLEVSNEDIELNYKAYQKRLKKIGFEESQLREDFHIPETQIVNKDNIPLSTDKDNLLLKIKAWDEGFKDDKNQLIQPKLKKLNIYVNNVPVYGKSGKDLSSLNVSRKSFDENIILSEGKNKVEVTVLNDAGAMSLKENFEIDYQIPKKKHDMYVLAIGASTYIKDSEYNLNYASKDASDLVKALSTQDKSFNKTHSLLFTSSEVSKDGVKIPVSLTRDDIISQTKEFLKDTKVDDEVVIFYSGHGLPTEKDYYLATNQTDFNAPEDDSLSYDSLEEILDNTKSRKKLMLLDSCHSGEYEELGDKEISVSDDSSGKTKSLKVKSGKKYKSSGRIPVTSREFELMQEVFSNLDRGSGENIISSSKGTEYSIEDNNLQNGAFTYSLIKNMKRGMSVSQLYNKVTTDVDKLTNGKQKPTSRKLNIDADFVLLP